MRLDHGVVRNDTRTYMMFETHTQVQMGTPIPFIQLLWLLWESRSPHRIRPSKIFHCILDQDPSLSDIVVGPDSKSTRWNYQPNKI